jgi:hypothetical protein
MKKKCTQGIPCVWNGETWIEDIFSIPEGAKKYFGGGVYKKWSTLEMTWKAIPKPSAGDLVQQIQAPQFDMASQHLANQIDSQIMHVTTAASPTTSFMSTTFEWTEGDEP